MADEDEKQQVKQMELDEERSKIYHFNFVGTVESYEDIASMDMTSFREKILDLFDIAHDKDLKELRIDNDDYGQEEHQYKITCGYYLKIKKDPNQYINEEFEKIVESEHFQGAVYHGFGLSMGPVLIRWEGGFKRLHQKDYKAPKTQKQPPVKAVSKEEMEEDQQRKELNKQRKAIDHAKMEHKKKDKEQKHEALVKEFADNHYQYDANNPNYKKIQKGANDDE